MFESKSIEEIPMKDAPSTSRNKKRRNSTHILENLFYHDPEYEDDSPAFQLFQELASIEGIDVLISLYQDNLQALYENLKRKKNSISLWSILSIKKLQFFLKHLQEKEIYDIRPKFDYSSIDENDLVDFIDYHFWDWSRKIDTRHVLTSYPSRKLMCSLESIHLKWDDSLPLNKKPASSVCGTKGSTSLESDSIDASIKSEEENFKTSYPNNHPNCCSNLECKVETSDIGWLCPNSSECHDT